MVKYLQLHHILLLEKGGVDVCNTDERSFPIIFVLVYDFLECFASIGNILFRTYQPMVVSNKNILYKRILLGGTDWEICEMAVISAVL